MREHSKNDNPSETTETPKEHPTTIVLVRHGTTPTTGKVLPGRAVGLFLSPEGMTQAKEVAGSLAGVKDIDAIYASPLERAQQTAEPLGSLLKKDVVVNDLLLECDFGDWTGQELKDLYKLEQWNTVQKSPSTFRFPNGESFVEMASRMSKFVEFAQANHPGKIVVAYSHADPIKTLLCNALGMHLDMFQRLMVATCSVSAISYSSSGPVVLGSNWQKNFSIKVS